MKKKIDPKMTEFLALMQQAKALMPGVPPAIFDKKTKRWIPNPEFVFGPKNRNIG